MNMVYCRGCGQRIHETALSCPHCGAQQAGPATSGLKSQTVAALLAAFLGGFGAHRFYLGKIPSAVLYLLFSWTGLPTLIAFVEMFFLVFMRPERWAQQYNQGRASAPVSSWLKALVVVGAVFLLVSFFAGVAGVLMPAYQDYTLTVPAGKTYY